MSSKKQAVQAPLSDTDAKELISNLQRLFIDHKADVSINLYRNKGAEDILHFEASATINGRTIRQHQVSTATQAVLAKFNVFLTVLSGCVRDVHNSVDKLEEV